MRAQNLKSYGCQTVAALVAGILAGICMLALSACSGTTGTPQFHIITPYGEFDGTTSNTVTIDTRPFFQQQMPQSFPPPIDYSKYPSGQLEK